MTTQAAGESSRQLYSPLLNDRRQADSEVIMLLQAHEGQEPKLNWQSRAQEEQINPPK